MNQIISWATIGVALAACSMAVCVFQRSRTHGRFAYCRTDHALPDKFHLYRYLHLPGGRIRAAGGARSVGAGASQRSTSLSTVG